MLYNLFEYVSRYVLNTTRIDEYKQMIVYQEVYIDGAIIVYGDLVIL